MSFANHPSAGPRLPSFPGQRSALGDRIQDERVDQMRRLKRPELIAHTQHVFKKDIPQRANKVFDYYGPRLREASARITLPPGFQSQWDEIVEGLNDTVDSDDAALTHRYVMSKDSTAGALFGVKFQQIQDDQKFLSQLERTVPQHASAFRMAREALTDLYRQDPAHLVADWQVRHNNGYTDKTIKLAGSMTLLVVASAAAVIAGLMAFKGKKSHNAFLLYAGIAALCVPSVRDMIFRSGNQLAMAEVDGAFNNTPLVTILKRYNVQGQTWSDYAESIMDGTSTETTTFLHTLKQHGNKASTIPADEVEDFVTSVVGGNEHAQTSLTSMIFKGDFPTFVNTLKTIKSSDARDVAIGYINQGAARYNTAAKNVARTVENGRM